jgi:hypothetical protein
MYTEDIWSINVNYISLTFSRLSKSSLPFTYLDVQNSNFAPYYLKHELNPKYIIYKPIILLPMEVL